MGALDASELCPGSSVGAVNADSVQVAAESPAATSFAFRPAFTTHSDIRAAGFGCGRPRARRVLP
jgi:hypothetical protein